MADGVARSRLGFVAETGRFVAMETPWVRFSCLLLCLASYFSFFVFLLFSCFFTYVPVCLSSSCPLRLCNSHLLLSASTCFVVRVLSASVICTLPHLGILLFFLFVCFFFFRSSYFSGWWRFFLLRSRTRYASTWFAYLDSLATFGFSLSHCDHRICIRESRMKNQEGHWGYCWCWVARTVWCEYVPGTTTMCVICINIIHIIHPKRAHIIRRQRRQQMTYIIPGLVYQVPGTSYLVHGTWFIVPGIYPPKNHFLYVRRMPYVHIHTPKKAHIYAGTGSYFSRLNTLL